MTKTTEQLLEALGVTQEQVVAGEAVRHTELTVAEVKELCESVVYGSPNDEQKAAAITALKGVQGLADDIKVVLLTDVVTSLGGQVNAAKAKGEVSRLQRKSTTPMKSRKPEIQT